MPRYALAIKIPTLSVQIYLNLPIDYRATIKQFYKNTYLTIIGKNTKVDIVLSTILFIVLIVIGTL